MYYRPIISCHYTDFTILFTLKLTHLLLEMFGWCRWHWWCLLGGRWLRGQRGWKPGRPLSEKAIRSMNLIGIGGDVVRSNGFGRLLFLGRLSGGTLAHQSVRIVPRVRTIRWMVTCTRSQGLNEEQQFRRSIYNQLSYLKRYVPVWFCLNRWWPSEAVRWLVLRDQALERLFHLQCSKVPTESRAVEILVPAF